MRKIRKIAVFLSLSLCLALAAAACGAEPDYYPETIRGETARNRDFSDGSVMLNNNASLVMQDEADLSEPFTSYTFEFKNYDDKYIITVTEDSEYERLILSVEDNAFGLTEFYVQAPERYMLHIPNSAQRAFEVCTVLKNTVDETPYPEILQFVFYLSDFSEETAMAYKVSKFFAIKDGALTEIKMIDATGAANRALPYTADINLYRSELNAFMPPPVVFEDENGRLQARAAAYFFNPADMTMTKTIVDSSPNAVNPVYYGYARHAVASEVYRYFATDTLKTADEPHVEVPVPGSDSSNYYFKVDDPRFPDLESLRNYAREYFDESIVNDMFLTAPQKYRDIDGELYTLYDKCSPNPLLGKLTIVDCYESFDSFIFYTKQEKFDEQGNFAEFIDGGEFRVSDTVVEQYRFPY